MPARRKARLASQRWTISCPGNQGSRRAESGYHECDRSRFWGAPPLACASSRSSRRPLIAQNLRGKRRSNRRTSAKPGDERMGYELVIPITIPDRRELEERARKELRSLSSYVAKLIAEDVAK